MYMYVCMYMGVGPDICVTHSFSNLPYDRSKASSKASSPHSAI